MDNAVPAAEMGDPTLASAFAQLHALSRAEPEMDLGRRLALLKRLERALVDRADELCRAVSADFGHRSEMETRVAEIFPSLEGMRHAERHLRRWMRPRRRSVSHWFLPAQNHVIAQPLGLAGVVVPWNYPLFLALGPLVSALSAGNRLMVKMSEFTPRTGQLLGEVLEAALGRDVVRVFNGPVELAEQFCRLPFDHLLFTGSTAVGRHVMRAAADNLTPVTLELGGKSPVIVAADADLGRAARAIATGKLFNAGQTCVAPDYVLVTGGRRAALCEALSVAAARAWPSLRDNPDLSSIVNERHYERLRQWREEARSHGAEVLEVNPRGEDLAGSRKMPLTLLWNCPDDCSVMQQEIFGPLLPIVEVDDVAAAIDYVNARPRPLALYLFSEHGASIDRVLRQTVSGGVCVNETMLHVVQDDLPFGGVGPSGMGHYHGHEGFLTFSKLKPVLRQRRLNTRALLLPPYGRFARWIVALMMGR
jgi:aldehyde dehydrogenase (NAD+)/coniferyl-aldehyde dehydrogenase